METLELKNPFVNGKIVSVDTDPKVYHAVGGLRGSKDFVMSSSSIRDFAACPHEWLLGGEEEMETVAQTWGQVFEILVAQPNRVDESIAVRPETYTNSKGQESEWTLRSTSCKEWEKRQKDAGKITINAKGKWGFEEAQKAAKALKDNDLIRSLLKCSKPQVWLQAEYHDRDTGLLVPVKGLLDLLPGSHAEFYGRCIADLKSGRNINAPSWSNEVRNRGLDVQAAWYLWLAQSTGEDRTDFLHVLSKNVKPYECDSAMLSGTFLEMGQRFIAGALPFYCQCVMSGKWPGYNYTANRIRGWTLIEPKSWMMGMEADFPQPEPRETKPEPTSDPNDLIP